MVYMFAILFTLFVLNEGYFQYKFAISALIHLALFEDEKYTFYKQIKNKTMILVSCKTRMPSYLPDKFVYIVTDYPAESPYIIWYDGKYRTLPTPLIEKFIKDKCLKM